jgi:hypothetical protein
VHEIAGLRLCAEQGIEIETKPQNIANRAKSGGMEYAAIKWQLREICSGKKRRQVFGRYKTAKA